MASDHAVRQGTLAAATTTKMLPTVAASAAAIGKAAVAAIAATADAHASAKPLKLRNLLICCKTWPPV